MTQIPGRDEPEVPRERPLPYVTPVTAQPSRAAKVRDADAGTTSRDAANRSLTKGFIVVAVIEAVLFGIVLLVTLGLGWLDESMMPVLALIVVALMAPVLAMLVLRRRRLEAAPGGASESGHGGTVPSSSTPSDAWSPPAASSGAGSYLPGTPSSLVSPPGAAEYGFPVGAPVPLTLVIEDVFTIRGRGVVVVGVVAQGRVAVGDRVRVTRSGIAVAHAEVSAVEALRRQVEVAELGDRVGLLLADLSREQLAEGDVVEG